ncbi:MAG TPA: DUF4105 domain-containing protein [Ginsengibacter sp.]
MKFFIVLLFLLPLKIFAQNDSCHLRISILTCSPGEELYSTFGHSAIRVTDSVSHNDIVYNYGTFDFDEPGFYTKFIRGKLTFYLSPEDFDSFVADYTEEKRDISEQVLNLTCAEKYNVVMLLQTNMMAANRTYKYDFTFDNCTTRLRDLIEKCADTSVHFEKILTSKKTFRDLIYEYLDKNDKQWSKLGIDILLGARMDVVMTPRQVMFLPDYLLQAFDSATIDSRPLVSRKQMALEMNTPPPTVDFFSHPIFIFSCLFLLIVLLSFSKNSFIKRLLIAFDGFMFFITGLLGILLIFMWIGTDHFMCKDNFNLLWAWPTNIVAAFLMHSARRPATKYFKIYAVFNLVLFACWFFLPQHLNPALIPVIAILVFRSFLYNARQKTIA